MLGVARAKLSRTVSNTVDYTVTSTTFVDLAAARVVLTLPGSHRMSIAAKVDYNGMAAGDFGYIDVAIDGVRQGGANGLAHRGPEYASGQGVITFVIYRTLRAGQHTFQLMARATGGTGRFGLMYWGTGHTEMTVSDKMARPRGGVFGVTTLRPVSYQRRIVAAPGIRNYWPLDEASGTRTDIVGGVVLNTFGTASKTGSLVPNDPTGGAITGGNSGGLVQGAAFTWPATTSLECWLYVERANMTNNGIVGASTGTAGAMLAFAGGANELRFYTSNTYLAAPTAIAIAVITHVVGTFDGTDRRMYVNGVLVAGPTAGTTPEASPPTGFEISGYNGTGSPTMLGSIGHVAVYNRALGADEIMAHYRAGTA